MIAANFRECMWLIFYIAKCWIILTRCSHNMIQIYHQTLITDAVNQIYMTLVDSMLTLGVEFLITDRSGMRTEITEYRNTQLVWRKYVCARILWKKSQRKWTNILRPTELQHRVCDYTQQVEWLEKYKLLIPVVGLFWTLSECQNET